MGREPRQGVAYGPFWATQCVSHAKRLRAWPTLVLEVMTAKDSLYQIPVRSLDGTEATLEPYRGKVMLIVNVASACGFTPQYEGLEKLYRSRASQGLVVLGFPCNQFGKQEPGCAADIPSFTRERYDVTFPLFEKIDVNGPSTDPLYQVLKRGAGATRHPSHQMELHEVPGRSSRCYRGTLAPKTKPPRSNPRSTSSSLPRARRQTHSGVNSGGPDFVQSGEAAVWSTTQPRRTVRTESRLLQVSFHDSLFACVLGRLMLNRNPPSP